MSTLSSSAAFMNGVQPLYLVCGHLPAISSSLTQRASPSLTASHSSFMLSAAGGIAAGRGLGVVVSAPGFPFPAKLLDLLLQVYPVQCRIPEPFHIFTTSQIPPHVTVLFSGVPASLCRNCGRFRHRSDNLSYVPTELSRPCHGLLP